MGSLRHAMPNQPDVTAASDAQLLGQVQGGDRAAFAEIMRRQGPALLAMSDRLLGHSGEAEEVIQDAFLRLWRSAEALQDISNGAGPWLTRVARHLCLDRLRARKNHDPDALESLVASDDATAALEERELGLQTRAAITALPERQAQAVTLFHVEGLAMAEVAQRMDVSVQAIESLLARGRRGLKQHLAAVWEEYSTS